MAQEKKINWGIIVLSIAILVLAASVIFTGVKVINTTKEGVKNLKNQVVRELEKTMRKEAISFIYAYRKSAVENRKLSPEDIEEGYRFADKFLSK